jgi:hypothetical protein
MSVTTDELKEPTVGQRWLYSLANMGNTIPYQMANFFLFFFTDVRRLPVAIASSVMFAYSIWDAVNNPIMGYISDRTKTRWAFPTCCSASSPMPWPSSPSGWRLSTASSRPLP